MDYTHCVVVYEATLHNRTVLALLLHGPGRPGSRFERSVHAKPDRLRSDATTAAGGKLRLLLLLEAFELGRPSARHCSAGESPREWAVLKHDFESRRRERRLRPPLNSVCVERKALARAADPLASTSYSCRVAIARSLATRRGRQLN